MTFQELQTGNYLSRVNYLDRYIASISSPFRYKIELQMDGTRSYQNWKRGVDRDGSKRQLKLLYYSNGLKLE